MGFDGFELHFEVFDVAFFSLAECSLSAWWWFLVEEKEEGLGRAYAALFWAFRLLWAGVRLSLSSSLLPPRGAWSNSTSPRTSFDMEPELS